MFQRRRPALLITPVVTLLLGLLLAAVVTYLMPKQFQSFSTIRIAEPEDFAAEVEKTTSGEVLGRVSDELDLPARWHTDRATSIATLGRSVTVEWVPAIDLLSIRARHANPVDARDIAAAVAHVRIDLARERSREVHEARLREMEEAIEEQRGVVVDLRARTMRESGIAPGRGAEPETELEIRHEEETDVLMRMKTDSAVARQSPGGPEDGGVSLIGEPVISDHPYSPNVRLNLILGAAAGFTIGILPLALLIICLPGPRTPGQPS